MRPSTVAVHSSGWKSGATWWKTAVPGHDCAGDDGDPDQGRDGDAASSGHQLACRALLSSMAPLFHGTASIAPVTELRRKSTLLAPESSTALITWVLLWARSGSAMVTLVPAVT